MKFASLLLPLVPAALAGECVRDSACAGCDAVGSIYFTQSGSTYTATSSSYGSITMNDKTITIKNTAKNWLMFCIYGDACFPIEAGATCTSTRQSTDKPALGVEVWTR